MYYLCKITNNFFFGGNYKMSDVTNEKKKYCINKDGSAMTDFKPVSEIQYIRSNDLCTLVSEVFRAAFADYHGCTFETVQGAEPVINLFFNHGNHKDDSKPCACEMAAGQGAEGNNVVARSRQRDSLMRDGDRYVLTEDGKDVISELLIRRLVPNNGNINWKNIVGEYYDQTAQNMYFGRQVPQYTKVSGIDVKKICAMIFGSKDDKDTYDYGFQIMGPANITNPFQMPGGPQTMNYMLSITRAHTKEINEVYTKMGIASGSNIIQ